jgi:hypothetical protein
VVAKFFSGTGFPDEPEIVLQPNHSTACSTRTDGHGLEHLLRGFCVRDLVSRNLAKRALKSRRLIDSLDGVQA